MAFSIHLVVQNQRHTSTGTERQGSNPLEEASAMLYVNIDSVKEKLIVDVVLYIRQEKLEAHDNLNVSS